MARAVAVMARTVTFIFKYLQWELRSPPTEKDTGFLASLMAWTALVAEA